MKALALISGGLDSILAARIIKDMGIDVAGLYCAMPFSLRDRSAGRDGQNLMDRFAARTGIALRRIDITGAFLGMLGNPKFGYGAHLNPCIDCRILMLRTAREAMHECGASFLISGEVVGQRPLSQQRRTLQQIDAEARVEGLVLRPLSAQLLDETIAEKQGWVRRDRLYAFSGRSRKPQTDLAVMLGIIEFQQPAGGCLLTDPRFTDRLRDLMKREPLEADNVALLKLGRHYRIGGAGRLIVGRDESDNEGIERLARSGDIIFEPPSDIPGPTALGRKIFSDDDIMLCCRVMARYCDRGTAASLAISWHQAGSSERSSRVAKPLTDDELATMRI
ncbi:MAG TPA: tRNA 4-thiouridine(8) synthase ThiI [Candidatus Omnitrophota bacterium]|nr:tRNA 4-thiouridine(8) synthase ThiI [Candidatus Omnitrophota bacterium]HNQ50467.1 tRNA 4-thiouridine(8) synthase ThiI [Candidatus Omnitrophota bacterium]HQO37743.1 tRNA 4-thiouridine(8) synthase ThiI [Candidatus Omnitrophota bacterium]HQQ05734.1 tRNA 4-thiouridine(8) synthase ThiI [Candidatus Omnitrophota bacterium]